MAIKFPPRHYFTFAELLQRWECEPNDVRAVITTGALVPAINVERWLLPYIGWKFDPESLDEIPRWPNFYSLERPLRAIGRGWLALHMPRIVAPHDCEFEVLCSALRPWGAPSEEDFPGIKSGRPDGVARWGDHPGEFWWDVPADRAPLRLSLIEGQIAFMLTEVARFEAAATNPNGGESNDPQPLGTRERNTLLKVIVALASVAKLSLDEPSKSAEVIATEAAKIGRDLAPRTIAEKLKLARDNV
jgi:hypothetical protein